MVNHKWKDNVCVKCGLRRKRKGWKRLMAITDYPPYNHYETGVDWFYSTHKDFIMGTFQRPECLTLEQLKDYKI